MHKFIFALAAVIAMMSSFPAAAQAQQQEQPDPMELAAQLVDQMINTYDLDVVQAFKIDTMLQTAYKSYYAEMEKLSKSGVSSTSGQFQRVSDKWGDHIDKYLQQIMTEEQWAKYLRSESGKNKKRRDKRMAADKY